MRTSPSTRPGSFEVERLAAVEQRIADHEARCEERLAEIRASANSTLKAVEGLKSRFWAIVLSLLAWALVQLWSADQGRIARLESLAPARAELKPL
jgi:hypothetical protein